MCSPVLMKRKKEEHFQLFVKIVSFLLFRNYFFFFTDVLFVWNMSDRAKAQGLSEVKSRACTVFNGAQAARVHRHR